MSKTEVLVEEKIDLQEQFNEQISEFATGQLPDYDNYKLIGPKVLVQLFKFKPTNPGKALGKAPIIVYDHLNKQYKDSFEAVNEKIYNIARVIKKGEGSWGQSSVQPEHVEIGDLFVVPYNEVVGVEINPDFMHAVNTYKGKTGGQGALVKITDEMGIPQNLPTLQIKWKTYKFARPDKVGELTEDEQLTFLIPSQKLEAKYEPIKKRP